MLLAAEIWQLCQVRALGRPRWARLQRVLRRIARMAAVVAHLGALLSYPAQVLTETSMSGEHLCHPVGDSFFFDPVYPFWQTGSDGLDGSPSRNVRILE